MVRGRAPGRRRTWVSLLSRPFYGLVQAHASVTLRSKGRALPIGFFRTCDWGLGRMGGKQGYSQGSFMLRPLFALVIPLCAASLSGATSAAPLTNPLRFFEGRTETAGTMSVVMHK